MLILCIRALLDLKASDSQTFDLRRSFKYGNGYAEHENVKLMAMLHSIAWIACATPSTYFAIQKEGGEGGSVQCHKNLNSTLRIK